MKIPVTLIVEMTDAQVAVYAEEYDLPRAGGRVMARDVVASVRAAVLTELQNGPAFHESGAEISIKGKG